MFFISLWYHVSSLKLPKSTIVSFIDCLISEWDGRLENDNLQLYILILYAKYSLQSKYILCIKIFRANQIYNKANLDNIKLLKATEIYLELKISSSIPFIIRNKTNISHL